MLQQSLAANEQEEKSVLLLLENKNAALATEAKEIYATCNRHLYSPVVDDNARAALIEHLGTVITKIETA